jgi:hypothetical protein
MSTYHAELPHQAGKRATTTDSGAAGEADG